MRHRLPLVLSVCAITLLSAAVLLFVTGFVPLRTPSAKRYPVRGIDVSHHQGEIAWPEVAAAGVDFALIKLSEGSDHKDPRFEDNWRQAGQAGVARGAYHFFTFCALGREQAAYFLAALPDDAELPPSADVEFTGNCVNWQSIDAIQRELKIFLESVHAATGVRPLLYVNHASRRRIVADQFGDFPLWVRDLFFPPSERGGAWLFWQYSDEGRVNGITGPVDLNVFRRGRGVFRELLATRPAEP